VFLLDSFPARTFSGNVASVVLLESAAPDWWMQGVAAELGAPTTGFVDLLSARAGHARVRFFTPRQETDACGHVTVAIATVLLDEGVWTVGPAAVTAAGGRYPLVLDVDDAGVRVKMQQQLQHLDRDPVLPDLAPLLGRARPAPDQAPVIAGTGLRHLLLPVAAVEDLDALPMCVAGIADVSRELQVDTIGVYNIVGITEREIEVRMRDLCAGIGATEESASGTTTGTLAFVLADAGRLTPQRPTLRMLMGVEMQRPGRLSVKLDFDAEGTDRAVLARLHGYGTRVLTGTIETAH
jgi:PhzF family phenazine biosynthesis protein